MEREIKSFVIREVFCLNVKSFISCHQPQMNNNKHKKKQSETNEITYFFYFLYLFYIFIIILER